MTPTDKSKSFSKLYLLVDKNAQTIYSTKVLENGGNRYNYTVKASFQHSNFESGLKDKLDLATQNDRSLWPETRRTIAATIATRTRDEWCALMEGSDVCFAPILNLDEAPKHPHNVARDSFVEVDAHMLPGPAPRFSATPGATTRAPKAIGADTASALADWGVTPPGG